MPAPQKPVYVPARYVGETPMRLRPHPSGRYRDGAGRVREGDRALLLNPGDTLMVPETELRGQTYLVDPSGLAAEALWLGAGEVKLPEHAGCSRDDLVGLRFLHGGQLRQYEFHEGRTDFSEIDAPWAGSAAPDAAPDMAPDAPPNAEPAEEPAVSAEPPARGRARRSGGDTAPDAAPDAAVDAAVDAAGAESTPDSESATPAQGA